MASSSSSFGSGLHSNQVAEKLTSDNFLLWKAQVLPALRGAQVIGYVDGSTPAPAKTIKVTKDGGDEEVTNPLYTPWLVQDQQVLSFLLSLLSKEVLAQVVTLSSSREVWKAVEEMLASQSKAKVIQLRGLLNNTKKNDMTAAAYFAKMKGYADELATAGKKMDSDDLISAILAGFGADYNPFVTSITTKTEDVSLSELYSQFLTFEARLESHNPGSLPSVNVASRDKGGYRGKNNCGNGRGRSDNSGGGRGNFGGYNDNRQGGGGNYNAGNNSNSNDKPQCQLCEKFGHTVLKCLKPFDRGFHGAERSAGSSPPTALTPTGTPTQGRLTTSRVNLASWPSVIATTAMIKSMLQMEEDTKKILLHGPSKGVFGMALLYFGAPGWSNSALDFLWCLAKKGVFAPKRGVLRVERHCCPWLS